MTSLALLAACAGLAHADTLKIGLHEAMEAARRGAYQSEAARSQTRDLGARVGESRAALLPHVGATALDVLRSFDLPAMGLTFPEGDNGPAFPDKIGPFNAQDARVNGRLALFDAPAWKHYESAKLSLEKGRLDEKAAEENVAMAAAEAYLALDRAHALVDSRRGVLALASQLADLSAAQKQAGAADQVEVLRARGQVVNARSALAAAEGAEEQARYVLLRITGMSLAAVPEPADSLSPASALIAKSAADGAADDSSSAARPELAAAAMERRASSAELGALKSGYLPSLELAADYGLSGRRLNSRAEWTETIALQLNWNLWDGGGRDARLAQQKEKVKQADLRIRDLQDSFQAESLRARAAINTSRQVSDFARQRVELAEQEEALARERFRSGGSGNLDVITAQNTVSAARQGYIDALYEYNLAALAYLKSLNRLSEI
jgi:outer membrane protein